MKKIFTSKIFLLLVVLVALCTVLSSCGNAQQTINVTVTAPEGSSLTSEQLSAIGTLVRNNGSAWNDFVAAYRGYDVLGADKSLASYPGVKDEEGNYVINVEAAKAVLQNYDTNNTLTYATLSASDVEAIVNAMKLVVTFDDQRDIFETLRLWIGTALGWITNTVGFGNYLLGICIFAIIVEILMIPLSIKQQQNSIKQANLRPKEMAIRNHYKGRNDQATQMKVNEEIQSLYERENFNPMSGCLPMLIQLPIIMLLYNIVIDPVQYVLGSTASFGAALKAFFTASTAAGGLGQTLNSANGTIEILSLIKNHDFSALADFSMITNGEKVLETLNGFGTLPTFSIGPVNFGYTPSLERNQWLLIVPVLTFVVYFFTMKISKKFTYQATTNDQAPGAGCSAKMMEFYMPVVSTMFSFAVPGAVGIYWVFRSVLSTLKQFIMSKVMPLPQFTEEDYKQAEKEMYTKVPQRKRKNPENLDPNREKPRSLHNVDDEEDYITFIK